MWIHSDGLRPKKITSNIEMTTQLKENQQRLHHQMASATGGPTQLTMGGSVATSREATQDGPKIRREDGK